MLLRADEDNDDVIESFSLYYIFSFEFEGKRKDTSLVITRSFQYFFEHRHQL